MTKSILVALALASFPFAASSDSSKPRDYSTHIAVVTSVDDFTDEVVAHAIILKSERASVVIYCKAADGKFRLYHSTGEALAGDGTANTKLRIDKGDTHKYVDNLVSGDFSNVATMAPSESELNTILSELAAGSELVIRSEGTRGAHTTRVALNGSGKAVADFKKRCGL